MSNKILVFIEQRSGVVKKSSFEALKAAGIVGGDIEAVCVGNAAEGLANAGAYGAGKVTLLKNAELDNYAPAAYAEAVANYAKDGGFNVVMAANTAMGKDLLPRIAVKLNAGIAVDVVEFSNADDNIIATRPVYAGKALVDVKLTSSNKVFTVRPNVFSVEEASGEANVEAVELNDVNLSVKVTEVKKSEGKLDVAEADIIVSGGRGMKGPEHFGMIEELADTLGAAVGASRAVVDAGWRPHNEQVGQTGKTVSPTLYVAVGISGAIQHLAGMRSSKYIVAVNKDKDAPIFQVADYGITGDAFDVVPALIEEIKKLKS